MPYASIGVTIKIGEDFSMTQHTNFGDLGGAPSALDATTLLDRLKKTVPGVQDAGQLEIDYFYDNKTATSDFRKIKAFETAGTVHAIEIGFPDGSKWKNTAYVSTYPVGAGVDEVLKARLVLMLQSGWEITNPT